MPDLLAQTPIASVVSVQSSLSPLQQRAVWFFLQGSDRRPGSLLATTSVPVRQTPPPAHAAGDVDDQFTANLNASRRRFQEQAQEQFGKFKRDFPELKKYFWNINQLVVEAPSTLPPVGCNFPVGFDIRLAYQKQSQNLMCACFAPVYVDPHAGCPKEAAEVYTQRNLRSQFLGHIFVRSPKICTTLSDCALQLKAKHPGHFVSDKGADIVRELCGTLLSAKELENEKLKMGKSSQDGLTSFAHLSVMMAQDGYALGGKNGLTKDQFKCLLQELVVNDWWIPDKQVFVRDPGAYSFDQIKPEIQAKKHAWKAHLRNSWEQAVQGGLSPENAEPPMPVYASASSPSRHSAWQVDASAASSSSSVLAQAALAMQGVSVAIDQARASQQRPALHAGANFKPHARKMMSAMSMSGPSIA